MFEADEAAANEPRRQARTAARKLDAAIDTVRVNFGRFLLGATGIDEFEDRWHLSKNDIRASVEPMVFPNTGTMRRIQNAMKADWKLAHPYKLAMDHDDAGFGSMPEGDGPPKNLDTDETYHPSSGNLVPEGDFEGWKNSVDQDGPEKVESNDFTPGDDSGSDRQAHRRQASDADNYQGRTWAQDQEMNEWNDQEAEKSSDKKEAAMLVADIYTDFAQSNGLRVASMRSLDAYASTGIAEADYRILANLIRIAEEAGACDADEDDEDTDSEAPEASESDDSDSDDDEGDDYDFGGEDAAEDDTDDDHDDSDHHEDAADSDDDGDHDDDDHHEDDDDDYDFGGEDGGDVSQTFTVPDQAPDLDPQMLNEIPHDNPQGAAPVPPEVIDSLLGLPEGTIEQLLLEEVQQGQGGSDGFGGAPQGGGDDFLGQGGDDAEQEPPRVARRRQAAGEVCDDCGRKWRTKGHAENCGEDLNDSDSPLNSDGSTDGDVKDYLKKKRNAARQFWAAPDEDEDELTERQKREQKNSLDTKHESWMKSKSAARRFWADSRRTALGEGETPSLGPLQGPMDLGFGDLPEGVRPETEDDLDMAMVDKLHQQYHDDPFRKYGPELDPAAGHAGFGDFSRFGPDSWDYDAINRMTDARQEHERGRTSRRRSARSFWAAEGDEQAGGDPTGGAQPPAQGDPSQGGGDPAAMGMDPSAMGGGQPMLPPPGSGAVQPPAPPAPLENQPAEDALLDTANQAIMQMIDRETQEYQQIIDPLSQALQAIQFAQQVEQAEHPMDVSPPEGTVDVSPAAAPGGAQSLQQQAARRHQAKVEFGLRNAATVIAQRYRLSATGERMLLEAMGRGNYEHVREALQAVPREHREAPANHIGHLFAADNPRFSRDQWMRSVMASRGRLPFDRPRLAGETLVPTATMDAYEHKNSGVPEVSDNLTSNELPKMEGAEPHRKGQLSREADVMKSLQTWLRRQKSKGLADYGDTAAEGFLNTRKKPLGPRATQTVHDAVGAESHPSFADEAPAKVKVPKAVNPVTKKGTRKVAADSFYLRHKETGRHGEGYRLFPGPNGWGDRDALGVQVKWDEDPMTWEPHENPDTEDAQYRTERNPTAGYTHYDRKAYPLSDFHVLDSLTKSDPDETQDPFDPRLIGASWGEWEPTKQASFFTRKVPGWRWDDHLSGYLSKEARAFTCACGEKIAAPSYKTCACGKVWNVYAIGDSHHLASDTADVYVAREIEVRPGVIMASKKRTASEEELASGVGFERWRRLTHPDKNLDHNAFNRLPEEDRRRFSQGYDEYVRNLDQKGKMRLSQNHRQAKGDGKCTCWEGYERVPGTEPCASKSCRKKSSRVYRENLAAIERLADWTKYDDIDPSRDPKAKPPSTKIPKQPKDWTKRTFTGPDKGKWTSESDTFTPKKK
jgi:hypothetical protein